MAEVGWDDVTYLRKKNPKAAEARSNKVFRFFILYFSCLSWGFSFLAPAFFFELV